VFCQKRVVSTTAVYYRLKAQKMSSSRNRRHNLSLTVKTDARNVVRQLFKDIYLSLIFYHSYRPQLQFVNCFYSVNE